MDMKNILEEIELQMQNHKVDGKVADYIPALAQVDPNQFAMSITMLDGTKYNIGNYNTKFSIQSISKVFTFTKALDIYGKDIYARVGVEPSGDPFNSLVQLEYENGIPRNPFINAGAILVTDMLLSHYKSIDNTSNDITSFIRTLSDNNHVDYDEIVYKSEYKNGYRNTALASLMKSFGNIENDIQSVLQIYFKHCSIAMSTQELSRAMLYLANDGTDPLTNTKFLTPQQAKRIKAIMLTCGHYDASGEFAFKVGLPGKSGVGGGIVAVVPNVMSIAVFSPRLNSFGNSLLGTKALELFTTKSGLSIF
jgi:glutaminase